MAGASQSWAGICKPEVVSYWQTIYSQYRCGCPSPGKICGHAINILNKCQVEMPTAGNGCAPVTPATTPQPAHHKSMEAPPK